MEIITSLRKRNGFASPGMQLLGYALTPFFRCQCSIPAEISCLDEPIVFVCNHYEIFGPFAVVLSLPLRYRLWVNSIVVEPAQNIERMIIGTQHIFPFLSKNAARRLLEVIAPLVERVIGHFRPISVYREHLGMQMRSIEKSVDVMLSGEHIVLFPETAIPAYSHGSVTEFFRSFALIGEYYRRKTGNGALFCPLYVDKKHRRLRFGKAVRYGSGKAAEECGRIVEALRGQLLHMADEALYPQQTISS